MHAWFRYNVSGIDDEDLNTYPTDPGGDIQTRTQRAQHSKEGVHCHCRNVQHEEVDEELSRCSRHIRHKVDDEIETSDLDKHYRHIRGKLCKCICCGTIERKRFVLEQDWTGGECISQLAQRNERVE